MAMRPWLCALIFMLALALLPAAMAFYAINASCDDGLSFIVLPGDSRLFRPSEYAVMLLSPGGRSQSLAGHWLDLTKNRSPEGFLGGYLFQSHGPIAAGDYVLNITRMDYAYGHLLANGSTAISDTKSTIIKVSCTKPASCAAVSLAVSRCYSSGGDFWALLDTTGVAPAQLDYELHGSPRSWLNLTPENTSWYQLNESQPDLWLMRVPAEGSKIGLIKLSLSSCDGARFPWTRTRARCESEAEFCSSDADCEFFERCTNARCSPCPGCERASTANVEALSYQAEEQTEQSLWKKFLDWLRVLFE